MADISGITAPVDFGPLLTSFGRGEADIANTQANTALTASQKTGADIANAKAAWQLKGLQNLVSQATANGQQSAQAAAAPVNSGAADQSGVAAQPEILPGGQINKNGITAAVDGAYTQRPYVPSAHTAGIVAASSAYGSPEFGQAAMGQEKAAWDRDQQARIVGANNLYDQAVRVHGDSPDGAWARMQQVSPGMAQQLKANGDANGWTPAQLDQHASDWAETVGGAAFRHTGRDITDKNGIAYDNKTGTPVLGGVQAGLSASTSAELMKGLQQTSLVTYSDGSQHQDPVWKQMHYPSIEAAYAAEVSAFAAQKNSGGQAAQPAGSTTPSPTAPPTPAAMHAAPLAAKATQAHQAEQAAKDPLGTALQDTKYLAQGLHSSNAAPGAASSADQGNQAVYSKNRNELLQNTGEAAAGAQTSLSYLSAAKDILNSGGDITGLNAHTKAELSRIGQAFGINEGNFATRYQELAKDLGQAALNQGGSVFQSRMSNSQTDLTQHLNPNTTMTPDAARSLVDQMARQAQYIVDTGKRANSYVQWTGPHGEKQDPAQFLQWQNEHFPREELTKLPPPKAPAQAEAHLAAHPELKDAFKAKYGYLPK